MKKKVFLQAMLVTTVMAFQTHLHAAEDIDRVRAGQEDSGNFERGRRRLNKNRNSESPRDAAIGTPRVSGSACSSGTVGVTLSPDKKTMSVLFDEYILEAGEATGQRQQRKVCNIDVPFHVPQGMQVAIVQMEYRGYNFLEYGANSRFDSGFFFQAPGESATSPRSLSKRIMRFEGPMDEEFIISADTDARAQWSGCGESTTLKIMSRMNLITNRNMDDAFSSVDSLDLESATDYHLMWRSCRQARNPRRINRNTRRTVRQTPSNPRRVNREVNTGRTARGQGRTVRNGSSRDPRRRP